MAIAYDNAASLQVTSATSATVSLTVSSGSDRYLIAGAGTSISGGVYRVSGVTYNGVALTQRTGTIAPQSNFVNGGWYLANPASGANNLVASFTSSAPFGWLAGSCYTGVAQTAPEATNSGTGSGTTEVGSVVSTSDNAWGVMVGVNNGANLAASTGCVERTDATRMAMYDSNGPKTPAGTISMTFTGGNDNHGFIAFALAPAAAGYAGDIKSIAGVIQANIKSIAGVTNANMKSFAGVSNV